MGSTSGPVHPCPICGSPDQTCTNPDAPARTSWPQEDPTVDPGQGPGPLAVYELDGATLKLTASDAARLGATPVEGP